MHTLQLHAINQCLTSLPASDLRKLRSDITEILYNRLRSELHKVDIDDSFSEEISSIGWISRMLDIDNKDLLKFIGSIKIDNLAEEHTNVPTCRIVENHTIQLIICPKGSKNPSPMYINIHHINKLIQVNWESTGVLIREGIITTHGNPKRIPYIMFMLRNLNILVDLCP